MPGALQRHKPQMGGRLHSGRIVCFNCQTQKHYELNLLRHEEPSCLCSGNLRARSLTDRGQSRGEGRDEQSFRDRTGRAEMVVIVLVHRAEIFCLRRNLNRYSRHYRI